MPYFTQRRSSIFEDRDHPPRFVHYTSAEAALKIFESKELWMRNATCMADYREVTHGFDILKTYFGNQAKRGSFFHALEVCAPGLTQQALTLFDQWFDNIRLNTYIACLSEHEDHEDNHGRLSMWRAFGTSNVPRVAAVLNVPKDFGAALALNFYFGPIAYFTEDAVHAELDRIVQNIYEGSTFLQTIDRQQLLTSLFMMLVVFVTCLKHPGFHEEREWRVVYSPDIASSSLIKSSREIVSGVPQIVYKLPLDRATSPLLADLDLAAMFDRLIVGPTPYPRVLSGVFVNALAEAGISNAEGRVWASTIPIRG